MRDDSAEILFEAFLQEALVSSSGMDWVVHFLMLSIQHFLCWPWHCPTFKVSQRMILERMSWHVLCMNHAIFRHLTVARRSSSGPTRKLILLCTQSLVSCSKQEIWRSFLMHLSFESLDSVFSARSQGPCFTAVAGDGGDNSVVELELACKADDVASLDAV